MSILERYKRQAVLIGERGTPEIEELLNFKPGQWRERLAELMAREADVPEKTRLGRMMAQGVPTAAGGIFYHDTRPPHTIADDTAVTLATTAKALWTAANDSPTYKNDWYPGKRFWLRAAGRITTAATPGNLTFSIAYGTADNTGLLSTSAALVLIASQTNIMWNADCYITCRSIGATGTLLATGVFETSAAVIAATGGPIPGSAAAAATVDLTATSALNLQAARSGSTAETMQTQDKFLAALN